MIFVGQASLEGVLQDLIAIAVEAGADLIQLYTGLIYGGPGAPKKILRGLA